MRPAMLFAAGFGTRMGALTRDRPKPLIPVAGKPLIDHALDLVRETDPERIVANAHYRADMLVDHFSGSEVQVTVEQPDILDTGGGLKAALPLLASDCVFTVNTDAIWTRPNPLTLLSDYWDPDRMDALLICLPLNHAIGRASPGDFALDAAGRISRGGDMVYGGIQIVKTRFVADYPARVFSLNAIWDQLVHTGRLFGAVHPGLWCDVGHPEGLELAEALAETAARGAHV